MAAEGRTALAKGLAKNNFAGCGGERTKRRLGRDLGVVRRRDLRAGIPWCCREEGLCCALRAEVLDVRP